jgi:hypothetical protein
MNPDDKHLNIYFNNGSRMQVSFPAQIKNSMAAMMETIKRMLDSDKLVIQTEDRVLVIPWSSVKYVEASAVAGVALPLGAIKGAHILAAEEKTAQ